MTLQMLKLAGREFVILTKRDFQKLAAQAQRQIEDDYWTQAALKAEARMAAKSEKPISFEQLERELDSASRGPGARPARRPHVRRAR